MAGDDGLIYLVRNKWLCDAGAAWLNINLIFEIDANKGAARVQEPHSTGSVKRLNPADDESPLRRLPGAGNRLSAWSRCLGWSLPEGSKVVFRAGPAVVLS